MRLRLLLILTIFSGCSYYAGREQKNFETISDSTYTNLYDKKSVVKIMALRFSKGVIEAIATNRSHSEHWTPDTTQSFIAQQMGEHLGANQDSITFLITLSNPQYPCQAPIAVSASGMHEIIPQSMMPCEQVFIGDIYSHIYFENERGVRLPPIGVSAPRHVYLTSDEWLWAKFQIAQGAFNWFNHSNSVDLIVELGSKMIRLNIKKMRTI